MKSNLVLFLFLFWRLIDFLIIILSQKLIPYLGFFPYKEKLFSLPIPFFLKPLANFDGLHYLLIAQNGYQTNQQAFFPLYPLLIRLTSFFFFGNYFWAGFFISNFSLLFGLYFLNSYLKELKIDKKTIFFLNLFLLTFPTSFYFGAIYTESLFFFLFFASLYFLKKEKYFLSIIFGFLTGLTRVVGVFLIFPLFFEAFFKKNKKNLAEKMITLLSPVFGLLTYCFYLWQTTGDPFFFFTSQPSFGANRSTKIILLPQVYFRYLKIFFTARINFQYFIALLEIIIFSFVFFVLLFDFYQNIKKNNPLSLIGLNFFSIFSIILPTLTGTFSSIPRYCLLAFSFFLFLARLKSFKIKIFLLLTFLIFHTLLLMFFAQGYFIS